MAKALNFEIEFVMKILIVLIFFLVATCSFSQSLSKKPISTWKGILGMNDRLEIPFLFDFAKKGRHYSMIIKNGEERIKLRCKYEKDSITAHFPGIDSYLRIKCEGKEMRGYWVNMNKTRAQKIPLQAYTSKDVLRFEFIEKEVHVPLFPRYSFVFNDVKEKNIAVGIFKSADKFVSGTIMTETGDYRYLDGILNGSHLSMSTFNGIWAMRIECEIKEDSLIGEFYSGTSYRTTLGGVANDSVRLRKANSLTYVINDQAINFSSVKSLKGKAYNANKKSTLTLFQVMGSWCPNCLDEIVFFKELHKDYAKEGLSIVAMAYENQKELKIALSRLKKFKNRMQIPYEICYAGNASKEEASATFPMLNEIMSFPTSILVDENGKIRHIHTGFSGPATGKIYEDYKKEMREIIEQLLKE